VPIREIRGLKLPVEEGVLMRLRCRMSKCMENAVNEFTQGEGKKYKNDMDRRFVFVE